MVSERGPDVVCADREHPTEAPCAWKKGINGLGFCCVEDGLQHTKLLDPCVVYNELGVRPIMCTKWVELSPPRALVSSVGATIGALVQHWCCQLCHVKFSGKLQFLGERNNCA
eukprot:7006677-Ditylum_brightwellii.AAC.1